jgi:hypothetical protein
LVSHTPLTQVSAPTAVEHVPSSAGLVCAGSVGTLVPLASCGVHVCDVSSHQLPVGQSASTLQPPMGSHVPFELQVPDRHTTPPLPPVPGMQGPSPFA